jgi:hypothetical protein
MLPTLIVSYHQSNARYIVLVDLLLLVEIFYLLLGILCFRSYVYLTAYFCMAIRLIVDLGMDFRLEDYLKKEPRLSQESFNHLS